MELIPILSTIILVATISTFILAIGAYILYKIRESRGEHYVSAGPSEVRAELVTPAVAQAPVREVERAPAQVVVQQPVASSGPQFQPQPIFVQQQFRPEVRPSKVGVPSQQYNAGYTAALARDSKFMKYTTEGYVSAKEDINAGALKWK
ncbi:MAG: hypothetical protein CO128_05480 [Ignavibacteriales bacterium CG_4_9_14_3_um_filter_30_11]|nr:MAG: hypothetical protein COW08_00015 [Ignavibacteriales bacterium CG12_big_fil_rev_8_21_14_0_65_30_8]PJA98772.1 MAG: hypothetical protein CO128_05480 [Ignavibacteriales bacterium CG_4_9_14_3_um_filter_30_11]